MRGLLAAPLLAILLFPGAQAHMTAEGCHSASHDELCHLALNVKDLPARTEHVYSLHSERLEGDFPKDWIVTAFAGIQGEGVVLANLTLHNNTRHQWAWAGNAFHPNSTRIDETGHYELRLYNPGDSSVRYAFYYDQSCNCAFKVIPINGGFVLFNYDLPAARTVHLGFPTLDGWHVKGSLARLEDERGRWPQDFRILQTAEQKNKGWLQFDFETEEEGIHYVFVEAPQGVKAGPEGRPLPVELTPLLEVEPARSPASGSLIVLALIVGLVFVRRRT